MQICTACLATHRVKESTEVVMYANYNDLNTGEALYCETATAVKPGVKLFQQAGRG